MVFTQSIPQLAYLLGDTTEVYLAWSRRHRLPIRVEDIDGGAKLLWVGDKHLGHVVLYLHGGGFILPMADGAISFWRHVQKNAKETSNLEVGVVILDYSGCILALRNRALKPTPPTSSSRPSRRISCPSSPVGFSSQAFVIRRRRTRECHHYWRLCWGEPCPPASPTYDPPNRRPSSLAL